MQTDYSDADPEKMANFSRVNHAGYLYAHAPVNAIQFEVNEQGVNSKTSHAITLEASVDEPRWLFNGVGDGTASSGFFVSTGGYAYAQACFYEPDQRPFLFAIYDTASRAVLHLGHVVTLAGESVSPDWTSYSQMLFCGDSAPVTIYRYTGGVRCESQGMSRDTMMQILAEAGIDDLPPNESDNALILSAAIPPDKVPLEACGELDGHYETFSIRESQLVLAQSLGFDLLSEKPE